VQQSVTQQAWADQMNVIKTFVATGGQDVDGYITKLGGIDTKAATTQQAVNGAIKMMTAQAKADLDAGKLTIDQYTAKLATIPTEADKVAKALRKLPTTIKLDVTGAPEGDRTSSGGRTGSPGYSGTRASGGPVSANTFAEVTEGGRPELLNVAGRTYLMMGAQGGTVIPALQAAQAALAGQGATMRAVAGMGAPGTPALPRAGSAPALNLTVAPVFNGAIIDTAARVQEVAQAITATTRTLIHGDIAHAVDQLITGGGAR
jgi:hypothetical protein